MADNQVTNFGTAQDVTIRLPAKKGEDSNAQSAGSDRLVQDDVNLKRTDLSARVATSWRMTA